MSTVFLSLTGSPLSIFTWLTMDSFVWSPKNIYCVAMDLGREFVFLNSFVCDSDFLTECLSLWHANFIQILSASKTTPYEQSGWKIKPQDTMRAASRTEHWDTRRLAHIVFHLCLFLDFIRQALPALLSPTRCHSGAWI